MKNFLWYMAPLWCGFGYASIEKPIVVIIPSYNNERYVEKNLNSVFDQQYENYRVIYIDDCSQDTTFEMVQNIVLRRGQQARTTIIHNDRNCGAMANFYHVIHACCDTWDIVVQLDGDDWLKHNRVLNRVNQEYSDHDVWMTYGRCEYFPEGKPDSQKNVPKSIITKSAYREYERVPSHLRTFYAGLFKTIALQDFLYQGIFLKMNCDLATMFPLLEMAHGKVGFIDEIIHVYNCATPINDYKKDLLLQIHLDHVLRSREKYQPILTFDSPEIQYEPDVCIIDYKGVGAAHCEAHLKENIKGLGSIKTIATGINAIEFLEKLEASSADFIFIVDSCFYCTKPFDITFCTKMIQQTKAHVFCCDLGKDYSDDTLQRGQSIPPLVMINDAIYGWQFLMAEGLWRESFGARAHIYRKKTLQDVLSCIKERRGIELFSYLNTTLFDNASVGLCGKEPFFRKIA